MSTMTPPTPTTPAMTATDHAVPFGALTLHARRWVPAGGANEARGAAPIVMLHDSLGAVSIWRDFPEKLAAATGRTVIAYDRLGFGESSASPSPIPDDFVGAEPRGALAAVLDHLDLDRFVALGHSVGGAMAVEAAAQWPSRCEALITISAQMFAEDRTLTGIRAAKENFKAPEQLDRLKRYHGDKARWVLESWTESWLAPQFAAWTLKDVLPQVRCPVLTLHGELDEYGTTIHQDMIQAGAAGPVTRVTLPGIGHVPQREATDDVLAAIVQFLR